MQAAKAEELQLLSAERMLLAIESIDQVSQCCRLEQGACQHLQRRAGTSLTWATRYTDNTVLETIAGIA